MGNYVSRAGLKLEHALNVFAIDVAGRVCADFGSNVGGFVDCLLQRGARKVYAIETGYGVLDWKLRKDARVVVMERSNAMHVVLDERVSLVTIDVAWSRQRNILPAARRLVTDDGDVVSLIKPHYEADRAALRGGVLREANAPEVVDRVLAGIEPTGFRLAQATESPLRGAKGNREWLAHLRPITMAGPGGDR